jgi:hypothetical protein
MKKNIKNEINEMKYLFGYQRGVVISEQKELPMEEDYEEDVVGVVDDVDYDQDGDYFDIDSILDAEPGVAEPETKPKTRPGTKPDTDREEKPFTPGRPNRDPGRLPYEDPDTHPQGRRNRQFDDEDGDLDSFVMKYLRDRK